MEADEPDTKRCVPSELQVVPSDVETVHESYGDYDSGNNEEPPKITKKTGGKGLIPEQYPPSIIRLHVNH